MSLINVKITFKNNENKPITEEALDKFLSIASEFLYEDLSEVKPGFYIGDYFETTSDSGFKEDVPEFFSNEVFNRQEDIFSDKDRENIDGLVIEIELDELDESAEFMSESNVEIEAVLNEDGFLETKVLNSDYRELVYDAANAERCFWSDYACDTFTEYGVKQFILNLGGVNPEVDRALRAMSANDLNKIVDEVREYFKKEDIKEVILDYADVYYGTGEYESVNMDIDKYIEKLLEK